MKKIISLVLCTVMILSLFMIIPFCASAKEADIVSVSGDSGTTGDCTWTLNDDGLLTISGEGLMGDYTLEPAPWGTDIYEVNIEEGVTNIADNAFSNCAGLEYLSLPDSLESIGNNAFYGCSALQNVYLPLYVTTIGECAFTDCTELTSIIIPESVESIGEYAFGYLYDQKTSAFEKTEDFAIYISKDSSAETYAKDNGFKLFQYGFVGGCTWILDEDGVLTITSDESGYIYDYYNEWGNEISQVIIEDGVTGIGRDVFSGCSNLTDVSISDSVTSIGEYAFSGCENLTSITIPDSVESIECYTFDSCYGLTSINIPESVKSIGTAAFEHCRGLTSITISDSVKSIGEMAFYDCTGLTGITIPDSVKSIGGMAFCGCTGLTGITIPDSVKSIGEYAFHNCTGLTEVTIPDSVESIGDYAFGYVYNKNKGKHEKIEDITIYGRLGSAAETYAKDNGFTFIPQVTNNKNIPGDADKDGKISIADATSIQQSLSGLLDYDLNLKTTDVDGDGKVSIDDVTMIQQHLAGIIII